MEESSVLISDFNKLNIGVKKQCLLRGLCVGKRDLCHYSLLHHWDHCSSWYVKGRLYASALCNIVFPVFRNDCP